MSQEEARKLAEKLFISQSLSNRGGGFFTYTEPIKANMISRRGLEHCASKKVGKEVKVLVRNDRQSYPEEQVGIGVRVTTLQLLKDYEAGQERLMAFKEKQLVNKFNGN